MSLEFVKQGSTVLNMKQPKKNPNYNTNVDFIYDGDDGELALSRSLSVGFGAEVASYCWTPQPQALLFPSAFPYANMDGDGSQILQMTLHSTQLSPICIAS